MADGDGNVNPNPNPNRNRNRNPNPNPNPNPNRNPNPNPYRNPNPNPNPNLNNEWYTDQKYESQALKDKIRHIIDAVSHLKELERALKLSLEHEVATRADPAKAFEDLKTVRAEINYHYGDLVTLLLRDSGSSLIVASKTKSDIDMEILGVVAKALLEEPEGEEEDTDAKTGKPSKAKARRAKANREEDGEEGDGLLARFGNWLLARAEVCGRELTGFCDFWTAITTVLVVVQLLEKVTSVNLGNVATEHHSLLKGLLKDHDSFGKK